MKLFAHIRGSFQGPLVRPWALAGPVLVLIVCLPLLRPLRQPDPTQWHNREQMLAATVQAIVEHHSLAIDASVFHDNPVAVRGPDGHRYSPYSPMLPLLLAPAYWGLLAQGLDYSGNLIFVHYILTFIGASVPVAMVVGLIYRLTRMFELRRSLRVSLGLAAVFGGGLISYGVVLNPMAPAAFLILLAVSCISYLAVSSHPYRMLLLATLAGAIAGLAATIDPPLLAMLLLLGTVLLAMRWSSAMRIGAVVLYALGAIPVIAANLLILHSIGLPPTAMLERPAAPAVQPSLYDAPAVLATAQGEPDQSLDMDQDEMDTQPSGIQRIWGEVSDWIGRLLDTLVGAHGVLSHFPVLLLGLLGGLLVLHRNWTGSTKTLAAVMLGSCLLLILAKSLRQEPLADNYAAPWFISMTPLLMLWAGAWLKRGHRPQSWTLAGVALAFSVVVGLVGTSNPMPRKGYRGYSFIQAAAPLVWSRPTTAPFPGETRLVGKRTGP